MAEACCAKCGKARPRAILGSVDGVASPRRAIRGSIDIGDVVGQRIPTVEERAAERVKQGNRAYVAARGQLVAKRTELRVARKENARLRQDLARLQRERAELVGSVWTADVRAHGDHVVALERIKKTTGQKPADALAAGGNLVSEGLRVEEARARAQLEITTFLLEQLEKGPKS